MLRAALTIAFVGGVAVGVTAQATQQQAAPAFEVASVKPAESLRLSVAPVPRAQPGGRFRADSAPLSSLLWFAYGVRHDLIVGGPEWVRQDLFQISAKAQDDASAAEIGLMVQSLLRDRFRLVAHKELREMPVQALVRTQPDGPLGQGLLPMSECSPAIVNELRRKLPEKYPTPMGGMISGCSSVGLDSLATLLSLEGTPVIDATGLTGSFYYTLRSQFSPVPEALLGRPNTHDPNLPALSTALEEQLGLRLQSRRAPIEVLVIDSVERPTPD
jgi:uncharacterized protein (TIGR03435 family)